MPECLYLHFGELGAGDGGKAFLEKLVGWRGMVVKRVCVKVNCAEIRAARERESVAVSLLGWDEWRAIGVEASSLTH